MVRKNAALLGLAGISLALVASCSESTPTPVVTKNNTAPVTKSDVDTPSGTYRYYSQCDERGNLVYFMSSSGGLSVIENAEECAQYKK